MSTPSGSRLAAVDGLRAVAALWVVGFHMKAASSVTLWPGLDLLLRSGSTGVSLFLVLSGFCLYLPFAGGRLDRFAADTFFRRRCWRLLPTYYASLLVLLVAQVALNGRTGLPRLDPGELLGQAAAHVLLVHQLFPATFYGLNGAYWSLGLEWELYLLLPLLVWSVRRRGVLTTVGLVIAVSIGYRLVLFGVTHGSAVQGSLADLVLPNLFLGRWAEFGLGVLCAELHRTGRLRAWTPYLVALAVPAAAAGFGLPDNPLKHVLFGVVFAAVLAAALLPRTPVQRCLSWRPLVAVGELSYSLYLVHQPIVQVAAAHAATWDGASPARTFGVLVVLLPVILLVAVLLFVLVERRTLTAPRVSPRTAGPAAAAGEPAAPAVPSGQP